MSTDTEPTTPNGAVMVNPATRMTISCGLPGRIAANAATSRTRLTSDSAAGLRGHGGRFIHLMWLFVLRRPGFVRKVGHDQVLPSWAAEAVWRLSSRRGATPAVRSAYGAESKRRVARRYSRVGAGQVTKATPLAS